MRSFEVPGKYGVLAVSIAWSLVGVRAHAAEGDALPVGGPAGSTGPETPADVVVHGEPPGYAVHGQVTASRAPRSVNDVPQAITVVPKSLLEDTGARRIEDAIAVTPSVQLGAGFGSLWEDYFVRGSRVWSGTMYRNGYLGGYSNLSATDAVNVERVEILRGPAAALYGPGLPGGSINVITKRPEPVSSVDVTAGVGSFGTGRMSLDATGPVSTAVSYRMTAAVDATDGFRDFNTSQRFVANPVVALSLSPRTRVLLETQAFRVRYRPDPGGVPIIGGDPFALPTHRSLVEPNTPLTQFDGLLSRAEVEQRIDENTQVRVGVQRQSALQDEWATYPIGFEQDGRTFDRVPTHFTQHSEDLAVQAGLEWKPRTGEIQHDFVLGTDLRQEWVGWRMGAAADPFPIDVYEPKYGTPPPPVIEPSGPDNAWTYGDAGLYLNYLTRWTPAFRTVIGGRLDAYRQTSKAPGVDQNKGEVAPSGRFGFLYDWSRSFTTYASVSRGFWPVLGVSADAKLLAPERSVGADLGARFVARHDVVTMDVGVFEIWNRNISVPDPNHPEFQVQRGASVSRGLEVFVTSRPARFLRLLASYTLADAHVTEDPDPRLVDSWLPLVARHSGGGWIFADVPVAQNTVEIGCGGRAVGERHLDDAGVSRTPTVIPGYVRADVSAGYRTGSGAVRVFVQNVTGTRYVQSGNNASQIMFGAPRTVLATVSAAL